MVITVNGDRRDVTPDTTLARLIESLGMKPQLCAAQLNERIVPKQELGTTVLTAGDVVELIRIVGGG
jgi:sulfur carrier protein